MIQKWIGMILLVLVVSACGGDKADGVADRVDDDPTAQTIAGDTHESVGSEEGQQETKPPLEYPFGLEVRQTQVIGRGLQRGIFWSPESRYFLVAGLAGIWVYDSNDITREPRLFDAHQASAVGSIAFSADGSLAVSASAGDQQQVFFGFASTVLVWNINTFEVITRAEIAEGNILAVAFSPDGSRIAAGGTDKILYEWDVATGEEVARYEGHTESIRSVAYSTDGQWLATGSNDDKARLVNRETGEITELIGHTDDILTVKFVGDQLYSGSKDRTLKIWDVASASESKTVESSNFSLETFLFLDDGRMFVQTLFGGYVFDVESASSIGSNIDGMPSPDGLKLVQIEDGLLTYTENREVMAVPYQSATGTLFSTPDGTYLVAAEYPLGFRPFVWDFTTNEGRDLQANDSNRHPIALSPNGTLLATRMRYNVVLLDIASGATQATLEGHTDFITGLAWSTDGSLLASSAQANDSGVRIWKVAEGSEQIHLTHQDPETADPKVEVLDVIFSPDGSKLISVMGTQPRQLVMWEVATGEMLRTVELSSDFTVRTFTLAFYETTLVIAGGTGSNGQIGTQEDRGGRVAFYDAETLELIALDLNNHRFYVSAISISADNSRMATVGTDSLIIWDLVTREKIAGIPLMMAGQGVAFIGDSNTEVATTGEDWVIRVWDIAE